MKQIFVLVFALLFSVSLFSQRRLSPIRSRENILNEEYCSGIFKNMTGTYLDFMDPVISSSAMGYRNILEWLPGRVAGLQIYKTRDLVVIPYLRNQRAAVYIDEIPINADVTSFISIPDIAMIKIVRDPFVSGWRGPGGAILIYTKFVEEEE